MRARENRINFFFLSNDIRLNIRKYHKEEIILNIFRISNILREEIRIKWIENSFNCNY